MRTSKIIFFRFDVSININANENNEVQRIERTSISHLLPTNRRRPALLTDTSNRKKMILEVRTICKNLSFQFNELRTSVYYLLLFLLLWITVCSYKVDDYLQRKEISKSTSEWTECIFTIFQNNKNKINTPNNNEDCIRACGLKSNSHINIYRTSWFIFIINSHSIFLAFIFFPAVKASLNLIILKIMKKIKARNIE